jgi:hypothetical protein
MKAHKPFKVQVGVREENIESLLCSAFDGGSNYWMEIKGHREKKGKPQTDYPAQSVIQDGEVFIKDIEEDKPRSYVLTLSKVHKGLQALASSKKYSHHWTDIVNENCDQITGDVFLQFCLFGDVKYS